MAKKVSLGSAKRFGPRYGHRNKEKLASLENEHRARRKCPYCSYVKVKRESKGIWLCEKCGAKFAGKAYTIAKPKKVKEVFKEEDITEEDLVEEVKEEQLEDLDMQEPKEEKPPKQEEPDIPPELLENLEQEEKTKSDRVQENPQDSQKEEAV